MIDEWFEQSDHAQKLLRHLTTYYGPLEKVYVEWARAYFGVPVQILVLGPTEKRPYKLLATLGLSRYAMDVPEHLQDYGLQYAELVMAVPANWPLEEGDWPVQWLAEAAQMTHRQHIWLGWGANLAIDKPGDGQFSGLMLMLPDEFDPKAAVCRVGERDDVHFYQAVPIYPEEAALINAQSIGALMERFDQDFTPVISPNRKNYAKNE